MAISINTNIYDVGALVEVDFSFSTSSGQMIDPDVVIFKYLRPRQKTDLTAPVPVVHTWNLHGAQDPFIVRQSLGSFYVRIDTTGYPGTWECRVVSQGNGQAAHDFQLQVNPSSLM